MEMSKRRMRRLIGTEQARLFAIVYNSKRVLSIENFNSFIINLMASAQEISAKASARVCCLSPAFAIRKSYSWLMIIIPACQVDRFGVC